MLSDAGMEKGEVDEIVLVGGSTRIPKVHLHLLWLHLLLLHLPVSPHHYEYHTDTTSNSTTNATRPASLRCYTADS